MNTSQQLEADIERQRAELAETIDQLHDTLEVKARSAAKVAAAAAAAAVVGLTAVAVWRRTHRS